MKNKRIKKVFKMLGACFLISAISLSSVGCNATTQGEVPDTVTSHAESSSSLGFDVIASNSAELKLFSSEATTIQDEGVYCIEKTITATVYPLYTPYKEVTWTLNWIDETDEDDVSNYVVISQSQTDSRVLSLKCYQAFLNRDMLLTCTTVVGNFSATARVSYYGAPTTFSLGNKPTNIRDDIANNSYRKLVAGSEYNLPIILSNEFKCVNPEFVPNFFLTGINYGAINLTNGEILEFRAVSREDGKILELYLFSPNDYTAPISERLLKIEVKDSCELILTAERTVESFSKDGVAFESYVGGVPCFLHLQIRELVSGRLKTYNFRVFSE